MRILLALPQDGRSRRLRARLEARGWMARECADGYAACDALRAERFELMLLHVCLPKLDPTALQARLHGSACPPRVLLMTAPELPAPVPADHAVPITATESELERLLDALSNKSYAVSAQERTLHRRAIIETALDTLAFPRALKGRGYVSWLLDALLPNPSWGDQLTRRLYPACARAFGTTPAAVERCVRIAVEERSFHGELAMLERYFGSTVDPERGKPTNRAFLLELAERLRIEQETRSAGA